MKIASQLAVLVLATFNLSAATLYVSLESTNPEPPFATWATAATNIQDAVDAARAGDTVLVTNGVYAVGIRGVSVLDTNQEPPQLVITEASRVFVTNSIRLESVNGPLVTTVDGGGSVRCVYLGSNAVLSGFTLTNGNAGSGGGVFCEPSGVATNCTLMSNWAYSSGGGARGGKLYNCTLSGNEASTGWTTGAGGGAYGCTLYNCTLTDNHANACMQIPMCFSTGGGACECMLYNCTLTGNSACFGGGASGSTLNNCTLAGNVNDGVYGSTLYNCMVTGNSGWEAGARRSTLYNCMVTDNSEGGAYQCTLYNCTVTGNTGGGVIGSYSAGWYNGLWYGGNSAYNSIVYYNSGGNYDEWASLNYCCTTPLSTNGVGNITGPPLFMDMAAGDFRLREESPCIDAGTNLLGFTMLATNVDTGEITVVASYAHDPTDMLGNTRFIDGNFGGTVAWDIGAYEFNSFRPPRFSMAPQLTPDGWELNITGAANQWVHVQRSSDLKNWEDVWYGWMGADGVHQCTDGDIGPKVMFYRVVVE